jgi:hypothetical protein
MNRISSACLRGRLGLLAIFLIILGGGASLQAQYEVKSGAYNRLSAVPNNYTPVGPNLPPTGDPTITPQFANWVETSASSGPVGSDYPASSNTGIKLTRSTTGTTFASGVPRYFYGDRITPPSSIIALNGTTKDTSAAGFWRTEPVRPEEILSNPSGSAATDYRTGESSAIPALASGTLTSYYYSPHAREVFASTPGTVEVTWRSSVPDATTNNYIFFKERFTVSSATSNPVRNLYWTERSFNGPQVVIPTGIIGTINPVFSNVFPERVTSEYVVAGTPANTGDSAELRTVWFDTTGGTRRLHAYNVTGRILIEYLGTLRDDGTYEFLGMDIVSVQQALRPSTVTIELGSQLLPYDGVSFDPDTTLVASPVNTATSSSVNYYSSVTLPNGSLAYYAERENDIEDRETFYWLTPKSIAIPPTGATSPTRTSIEWPIYLNKYLQVWPVNISSYAHNSVAPAGSSETSGTGIAFVGGKIPQIVYQDSPEGDALMDNNTQRLLVDFNGEADQLNRSLLKFIGNNGGVWYVPLMTQADGRVGYQEGDGTAAVTGTAYVGERINPPSATNTLAGYVAAGTYYSPAAYIDPFANGVAEAEKGAIIPVNALPNSASSLTVWWFKKYPAPSSEFNDLYLPAKVGRYALAYRDSASTPDVVMASNQGTDSLATYVSSGTIYNQPDSSKVGYNPNEEHALMLGGRGYALRDDLNIISGNATSSPAFSSLPRILIQYTDPADDRPAMSVFEVLRENATYRFDYSVTAGTMLNQLSPQPLPLLPLPVDPASGSVKNLEVDPGASYRDTAPVSGTPSLYTTFTFKDRKGYDWVYRGPHDDAASAGLPAYAPLVNSEFDTANDRGIWTQNTNTGTIAVANGLFSGVATGNGDAQFNTSGMTAFAGSSVPLIQVRMKASANVTVQLFWGNEDGGYGGSRIRNVNYTGAGGWQTLSFDVSNSPDWTGKTINALRIDPVTATSQTFDIDWIRASSATALGMQFYYTMRSDFVFPNRAQPAVGTILPYLRPVNDGVYQGDPVTATPLTILYRPQWPAAPPTLTTAETLTLSKFGLPAVRGQTSARILYQQSIALSGTSKPSATLHDPTRVKNVLLDDVRVGLTALPASLKTTQQNGKTYFQLAQPHLQQRFYYDPNLGSIGGFQLNGEFVNSIAGEDYLNLNALSPDDTAALKGLVTSNDADKAKWDAAITALSTDVETFKEDPARPGTYIPDTTKTVNVGAQTLAEIASSETAVDSYALTSLGQGKGYVTLLFGDGEAFTPQGEPVSMSIIKITDTLYQGDLKVISASNPLDEQTTLRHSGDFAARPENYEFEWCYTPSVSGSYPPLYTYTTTRMLGTSTTDSWKRLANPTVDPSTTAPLNYDAAITTTLSSSFSVNNASYSAASNRPGSILLSNAGLTLSNLPSQVVFSANLGSTDGFVVYANNVPVLAYNLPVAASIPGGLPLSVARTGLVASPEGLGYQFEIDPASFIVGTNRIEVALYSPQGVSSPANAVDFRIHTPERTDMVSASGSQWIQPNGNFSNIIVVGGSASSPLGNPLLVFGDNYFTMRYRAKASANLVSGSAYSDWMPPVLVESWVKRVLDGINPFNQRQTDLYNNPVSTDVSILTQAGTRWEGDVALNLKNIEDFGLIEIYETVLNRVKAQSIDAGTTTDAVNSTLLLVSGYLNDLYMTLGNEAWDDAQNPTIQITNPGGQGDISSARFSFEGQVSTLIDETLSLLRGRDDFTSPGVKVNPSYNRLYWNYTNGINSGEPIYATNYNIKEKSGGANANGVLDAADAQQMFPQGHGDAYGHYLTAITGYYKLLTSPAFTWTPSTEGVTVLGQTVQVDYKDERKFAAAAAALARTGVDILDFTVRKDHKDDENSGWGHMEDGKYNSSTGRKRYWGSDEWAARGMQGTYFNWVSANAMLPDVDTLNEGIQKIDRSTVPEIEELVTSANKIFTLSSSAQAHMNDLGLAPGAMTFDISPAELAAGKSNFEQVHERAVTAAVNAKNAFKQAGLMNQLQRDQNNSLDEYNDAVSRQESAYEYELTTLFGTPYPGDVGAGKLYAQGYTGPDLYHYYFIDQPSTVVDTSGTVTVNFREPVNADPFLDWSFKSIYDRLYEPTQFTNRTYQISRYSLGQFPPSGYGKRGQPGKLQSALLDAYTAQVDLREATNTFNAKKANFDRAYQLYTETIEAYIEANAASDEMNAEASNYATAADMLTNYSEQAIAAADYAVNLANSVAESIPTVTGPFAFDTAFIGRGLAKMSGAVSGYAQDIIAYTQESAASQLESKAAELEAQAQAMIDDVSVSISDKQQVLVFERLFQELTATSYEINRSLTQLQRTNEQVARLLAEANHILSERETFRKRAAAVIQGHRTNDLLYRDLRNEALSQYKSLFDLAQIYAYCAAKSYDYETGLLGSTEGSSFVDNIVGTYSLGDFNGNSPIATGVGDSGLASSLANLRDEWSVVEGRLGFNNPDRNGTVFSLRQELFRIRTDEPTADDNTLWKQVLQQHVMSNVLNDPDVARSCLNIRKSNGSAVPGIVIEFGTNIEQGLNFFGLPIASGDHFFSQSTFSTKIFSSGLIFKGYVGMDPYAIGTPGAGGPMSSAANALSATPYAYLIPTGDDVMRAPSLGDVNVIRSWSVRDQALPLPKNLGETAFSALQFFTPQGTLNEQLWITRKHQAFRAVDDPAYFYSSMPSEFTNSRLISRSAWNTRWKIVIPAYSLLSNEQVGLDRFVQSVSDIKLFLRTYSNSGN